MWTVLPKFSMFKVFVSCSMHAYVCMQIVNMGSWICSIYIYIPIYVFYVTGNIVFVGQQFEQEQQESEDFLDGAHPMDEATNKTSEGHPFFDNEVGFHGHTFDDDGVDFQFKNHPYFLIWWLYVNTYMRLDLRKLVFHAHNNKIHFSPSHDSCTH